MANIKNVMHCKHLSGTHYKEGEVTASIFQELIIKKERLDLKLQKVKWQIKLWSE